VRVRTSHVLAQGRRLFDLRRILRPCCPAFGLGAQSAPSSPFFDCVAGKRCHTQPQVAGASDSIRYKRLTVGSTPSRPGPAAPSPADPLPPAPGPDGSGSEGRADVDGPATPTQRQRVLRPSFGAKVYSGLQNKVYSGLQKMLVASCRLVNKMMMPPSPDYAPCLVRELEAQALSKGKVPNAVFKKQVAEVSQGADGPQGRGARDPGWAGGGARHVAAKRAPTDAPPPSTRSIAPPGRQHPERL
jgi:hypothetical protein